ncbi:MAG: hypothetical protein H7A51_05250 [Akkermansiaceae bacterium]|nr:hypothetical protein [Akkermansiaceae bacterium]
MNTSRFLIPSLWIISLATAFVIGGKLSTSSDRASSPSDDPADRRPSFRQSGSNANGVSTTRRSAANRGPTTNAGSGRELNITDIARTDDPIARTHDLLQLISRLGAADFAQVVADFRELGMTRERMSEYSMLLHAWAQVDPLGALEYAENNTGSPYARQTILASWAANDPEGALAWAKNHHQGDGPNPWLVGVIRGVVAKDPARATAIMQELPYSRERGEAVAAIIPHIVRQGIEQASLWLDTITDERLRSASTAFLASALAKQEPAKTAEWLTTLADSEGKARATREVAEQWSEQDLRAAVAWTDTLTGENRMQAAREVIGEYAREDAARAASWLQSIAKEPGYEKVLESYIRNAARENPEMSLAQVPEIKNPGSQEKYYERILRNWRERDAQSAEAWMNNHELPEKVREKVLRARKDGR